ncbi:MAG TPA: hypothetical protein VGF69_15655 [Thermoanaerobaculia bacterium]
MAVVMLAAGTSLFAQGAPAKKAEQPAMLSTFQGAIDPATGRLRELTPEESVNLSAALSKLLVRSMDGIKITTHSDGSLEADLGGHFMNAIIARVNEDGTVEQTCVEDSGIAFDFMTHRTPVRAEKAQPGKAAPQPRMQRETE